MVAELGKPAEVLAEARRAAARARLAECALVAEQLEEVCHCAVESVVAGIEQSAALLTGVHPGVGDPAGRLSPLETGHILQTRPVQDALGGMTAMGETPYGAIAAAPLVLEGLAPCALVAVRPVGSPFTAKDIEFLNVLSGLVTLGHRNINRVAQLRSTNEHLRLAQDSARMGAWEWEIRTNKVRWSEGLERLHGREPGSFPGTFDAFKEDIHPEDLDRVMETIQKSVERGEYEVEYRIVLADGAVRWLAARGQVFYALDGSPERVVGICMDSTESIEMARQVRESEGRFRHMANSAPALLWVAGADGARGFFNQRWLDFTGRPHETEAGLGWLEGVHPGDRPNVRRAIGEAVASASPFAVEFRLRNASGEYAWVLDHGAPQTGADGRLSGFVGSATDISARKGMEDALRGSEGRFRALADALPIVVWIARQDGVVDYFNRTWYSFTGRTPGHGDDWNEAVHPADLALVQERWAAALADGLQYEVETRYRRFDGVYHWHIVRALPVRDDAGKVLYWVGTGTDIDSQKQAEELAGRFGRILEESLNEIFIFDDETLRFEQVNEGARRNLGYSMEELRRLTPLDLKPEYSREQFLELIEPLRSGEKEQILFETFHRRKDGSLYPVEVRLSLARTGSKPLFVAIINDITARRRAEEAMRLLADAAAELSSTLDFEKTLDGLSRAIVPRFADWCVIDVLEDGGLRRVAVAHSDPAKVSLASELLQRWPISLEDEIGVGNVVRTGLPEFYPEITDYVIDHGASDPEMKRVIRELGLRSAIVAPLAARGRILGAITLVHAESGRNYDAGDLAVAEHLCRRTALSLDNARLYTETLGAEHELRNANDALQFLADASVELGASLDFEVTLKRLAHLCASRFTDVCIVDVVEDDGGLRRVAVAHRDPARASLAAALAQHHPGHAPSGHGQVVATGESLFVPDVNDDDIRRAASRSQGLWSVLEALQPISFISVPLRARNRTLGAIGFLMLEGSRHFSESDLALAEDLGRRAGLFVDNAWLYTEAQRIEVDLRRASDAKDEFLGLMSHELRTPITVLYGGARVLYTRGDEVDPATRAAIVSDIAHESDRLYHMVENLLTLARAELTVEVGIEPVLIQRLVPRVAESFSSRSSREVLVEVPEGLPSAMGESSYIEHVLRNLLSNAEKYSPEDSPIEIDVRQDGEHVQISVLDRGIGLPPEEVERIFQRFYRSERTLRLAGGAGMGLAVCKRLVEAMSGTIWAHPREGGGLQVGFTLPLYEEHPPSCVLVQDVRDSSSSP